MQSFLKKVAALGPKWLIVALILFLVLPLFIGKGWTSLVIEMLIMSVAACGLNLMVGYGGMVCFGGGGLYAVGAYTTALLIVKAGVPFGVALIAGPVMAALVGVVVGWFCVRLTHVYFAFLTLAFSQIIYTIIFQWYGFTGGDDGMTGIPVPDFLASINHYYYFALAIVIVCLGLMWMIISSPFGKTAQALRENPERTEFIGIDVKKYKLIIFVLSSFFLGAAGSLFCGFNHNVFPAYAHWLKSTEILIMCLLGGMYNFGGPVVGSIIYIFLDKIIYNKVSSS